MLKLIICRHGDYKSDDRRLSEFGRTQMVALASKIKPLVAGLKVLMISSTAPRAIDSAEVLKVELGLNGFEQHEVLWSDAEHRQRNGAVLDLIRNKSIGQDVLILVSHLEYVHEVPVEFGKHVLQSQFPYGIEPPKGSARVVSCADKTMTVLR